MALESLLIDAALMNTGASADAACTRYLVTDSVSRFEAVGPLFLGEAIPVENIEVVDGVIGKNTF